MKKEEVHKILKEKLNKSDHKINLSNSELERLLLGQIFAESSFNERAVSPVGARGLAQFMPMTWHTWGKGNPFIAENAIESQIRYMNHLYGCYEEIPDPLERFKFTLAAYNCGRGNVNKLLTMARKRSGYPASHKQWDKEGRLEGEWQEWEYSKRFLHLITGTHHKETLGYVDKIMEYKL